MEKEPASSHTNAKLKTAFELFFTFFKIGAITFGGGLAMLPLLKNEVVEKKQWASDEEMLDYFAIGQSTPGIIATNVATFVGFKTLGGFGSIIATIAIVLPSLVIITIIATTASAVKELEILAKILNGINVAVAALLLSSLFDLSKKTIVDFFSFFLALSAFIAIIFFSVPILPIVICCAILGIVKKTLTFKEGNL